MSKDFENSINVFPKKIREQLSRISETIKEQTMEIRLRLNKPLILYGTYGTAFLREDLTVSSIDYRGAITVSKEDLHKTVLTICEYSLYSHQEDIANGFVTYGSGNRVGFCGTAVSKNGKITAVNNITSLNIRISRQFYNTADSFFELVGNNFNGILLAGPPCSGKTTMLKSIAHKLTSEYAYNFKKCVLIDERHEMEHTTGLNLDILCGYPKDIGITHAVRVLSPEMIICDEITTVKEAQAIINGMNTGVKFIVSTHSSNKEELLNRESSKLLSESGCFEYTVILKEKPKPCTIDTIYKTKDMLNEIYRNNIDNFNRICDSTYNNKKRVVAL